MFSAEHMLELVIQGWISNVPLAIGSIVTLTVFFERVAKFRGIETQSRALSNKVVEALLKGDLDKAQRVCEKSELPVAKMLLEGLRWQSGTIEDLDRVFATLRGELSAGHKKGIWMIGTTGSLAPFVGLFGTVVGIIRGFAVMADSGRGGFAVVASSLSEALVATGAGLGVAIVALALFNYLNVRMQAINGVYARASERLVQALLYLESSAEAGDAGEA
jgi:biopolymer transport protein ExbB/TolQ